MTINLTPRKCLAYRSPVEAFLSELGGDIDLRFCLMRCASRWNSPLRNLDVGQSERRGQCPQLAMKRLSLPLRFRS